MNRFVFAVLFTLICLGVACSSDTNTNDDAHVRTIKFFPDTRHTVYIEDIADTSFFRILSTDKESYLSVINQVFFSDSLMIIPQDREGQIYLYDLEGNPIGKIEVVGRSPGKAASITDVWYNEGSQLIDIFDASLSKVFTYDLDGKLVKEVKLESPEYSGSIFVRSGNMVVFERTAARGNNNTRLGIYNSDLRFQQSLLPIPEKLKNVSLRRTYILETYRDSVYYLPQLESRIYSVSPEGISTAFEFDLPKSKRAPADYLNGPAPENFRAYYNEIASTDYTYNFDRLFMTDKYISFNYQKGGGVGRNNVFFSRESKDIVQFSNLKSKALPGMELLSVLRGEFNGYFVITIDPTQNRYLPESIQKELDDNSNQVLMFFKLKKF